MTLKPMADNILLKQTEAAETTTSGIILATTKEKPAIYEVMSAGPDVKEIKAGDKVVIGNFTGNEIKLDGVDYKFVKLEDILAVVNE
jgi:chaperonin GroES